MDEKYLQTTPILAVVQSTKGKGIIMIRNNCGSVRTLEVETARLYEPQAGDWTYSHHASLVYFHYVFYAMWSNGKVNEDDRGQKILFCTSKDGRTWSAPRPLYKSREDGAVLTAAGWYVHGDTLNAYAGCYRYAGKVGDARPQADAEHIGTTLLCKTTQDGEHWSEEIDLHVPIVPNQRPQQLSGGRLIICGNVTFPYTDDPYGLSGWHVAGLSPCPCEGLQDDSEGFHLHDIMRGDGFSVCEGSYFEQHGTVRMLLRNLREPVLCLSESHDNGETWSPVSLAEFSDNHSKFYCMRLSDDRFAVVSNPEPKGPRCPLAISLSEDGERFDLRCIIAAERLPRRHEGMYKGGIYGYPHAIEVDGMIYVICSINKEDIRVFRFPLSAL